jgi:hypothetical protein
MLKKILKIVLALPLILILILIVFFNVRLGSFSGIRTNDTVDDEVVKQLRGIEASLNEGADIDMQAIYPEGYLFLNSIYSLAWCSVLDGTGNSATRKEGMVEIEKAWNKINSTTARAQFTPDLPLSYGSFYQGWSTFILGSKLQLDSAEKRNQTEVEYFKQQCQEISKAIHAQTYPVSYYGGAWPADVVLCVAALSLHDKIFKPKYEKVIDDWLFRVKQRLDAKGMIPHSVDPSQGYVREGARGSSQALMLLFLKEIDSSFANAQFNLFKENFVDTTFGLTGIREYPKGKFGIGDVDSGPILLGFGGAATIVGMQTLSVYDEHGLSLRVRSAVEAMAFPFENEDEKVYFFGLLPIADAFITWNDGNIQINGDPASFNTFRTYTFFVFTLLSVFFWIFYRVEKPDSKNSLHIHW